MERVTTLLDTIEEHLGYELSKRNMDSVRRLQDSDLKTLGQVLYEFSRSYWIDVPRLDEGENCFALHPNSLLTNQLGGVAFRGGKLIEYATPQLVGASLFVLTYLPRIAVGEGLQYFLDYYRYVWDPTPQRRQIIMNLLAFYAETRELIRKGDLILVPRSIWLDTAFDASKHLPGEARNRLYATLKSGLYVREKNLTEDFKKLCWRAAEIWKNAHYFPHFWDEEQSADLFDDLAYEGLKETMALAQFAGRTGYGPLLDTPLKQFAFQELLRSHTEMDRPEGGGRSIPTHHITLPLLSKLSVADFIRARQEDGFETFRACLSEIENEGKAASGPVELEELIQDKLEKGKKAIQAEVNKSSILSKAFDEMRNLGIGLLAGTAVARMVEPGWAENSWKVLVVGGTIVGGKVLSSAISKGSKAGKNRYVSRLFATLQE